MFLRVLNRSEKAHTKDRKRLLIEDRRWDIGCDLEPNHRNHPFPGGTGQISSTLHVEDLDSVSPQLFRVPCAVIWEVAGVTLLVEPPSD